MLGQFKDMQGRMQTMQEEMSQRTFSALAGGGLVTADVDGKMQLKRIKLDASVVNPGDIEMLEDLIVVAVAEAQKKAADAMQMELQKVTGESTSPSSCRSESPRCRLWVERVGHVGHRRTHERTGASAGHWSEDRPTADVSFAAAAGVPMPESGGRIGGTHRACA